MCYVITWTNVVWYHIDGLVQERRNSSALAMELRLSCINPLICHHLAILRSIFALCIAKWPTWPRGPKSLEFSGNELLRSPNRASWFLLPSWAPLCYGRCLVKPLTLLLVTLVWKTSDFVVIYIKKQEISIFLYHSYPTLHVVMGGLGLRSLWKPCLEPLMSPS